MQTITDRMLISRHPKHSIKNISALTLIELLVVIFVLGVGILSIALLITKNLSLTKTIHLQNSATILAREGIELSYHVRNTNTLLGYERNCAIRATNQCNIYIYTGTASNNSFTIDGFTHTERQIQFSGINTTNMDFESLFSTTRLYLTTPSLNNPTAQQPNNQITGYTHTPTDQPSTFARYITFTGLNRVPTDSPISPDDIHHISSIVLYKLTDNTTGSVILESFIANHD